MVIGEADAVHHIPNNDLSTPQIESQSAKPMTVLKPFQPENFTFPKRKMGNYNRSCQSSQFEEFKQLHYDEEKDTLLCFICMSQKENLHESKNRDFSFIFRDFQSWKDAWVTFKEHALTKCQSLKCGDVTEMCQDSLSKSRKTERHYFKTMECVEYLVRQGIAFRDTNLEDQSFV